jgi:hypothetical protein
MAATSQRIANRRMAHGKRSQTSQLRKCRPPLLRLSHRKNTKDERPITDNSLFAARVLGAAFVAVTTRRSSANAPRRVGALQQKVAMSGRV